MAHNDARPRFVIFIVCGIGAVVTLGIILGLLSRNREPLLQPLERDDAVVFNELPRLPILPVSKVERSVLVPTLDTPLVDGQTTVWCASFQLAWNQLKASVTHGDVRLQNAEVIAEQLNRSKVSDDELRAEDYFAIAAFVKDKVVEKIEHEMASRFPDAPRPRFDLPAEALVAFAFLAADVPWQYEFHDNSRPFVFTDSNAMTAPVRSFGILEEDTHEDPHAKFFRGQVALLWESEGTERIRDEFAIDLCRHSVPYQVVLARVKRKSTLEETLADLQVKMQNKPLNARLGDEDTLYVPTMNWRIEHHFKELEGSDKVLMNGPMPGLYLAQAIQDVQFRLNRRGASVASAAAAIFLNGGPRRLHFDRPFLLYIMKRDAQHPFFVMWVDNAELMEVFTNEPPTAGNG